MSGRTSAHKPRSVVAKVRHLTTMKLAISESWSRCLYSRSLIIHLELAHKILNCKAMSHSEEKLIDDRCLQRALHAAQAVLQSARPQAGEMALKTAQIWTCCKRLPQTSCSQEVHSSLRDWKVASSWETMEAEGVVGHMLIVQVHLFNLTHLIFF